MKPEVGSFEKIDNIGKTLVRITKKIKRLNLANSEIRKTSLQAYLGDTAGSDHHHHRKVSNAVKRVK